MSLILVAFAIALFAGCGGIGEDSKSDAAETQPKANAPRLSATDPRAGAPAGSAEAAVQSVLYWARWGAWPNVVGAYHPRVQRSIGSADIANTYSVQRDGLRTTRAKVVAKRKTPLGVFVAVEFRRAEGDSFESFLVAKVDGEWRILYDTFFDSAYGSFVEYRTDLTLETQGKEPAPAAVRAGVEASALYRSLFLPQTS